MKRTILVWRSSYSEYSEPSESYPATLSSDSTFAREARRRCGLHTQYLSCQVSLGNDLTSSYTTLLEERKQIHPQAFIKSYAEHCTLADVKNL